MTERRGTRAIPTPVMCSRSRQANGRLRLKLTLPEFARYASFVCAPCQGGVFQWVKALPDNMLQPEATGAGMAVTKCLKPPNDGHIGDRASVQAATRVNASADQRLAGDCRLGR
jgi:hypothetical protein